MDTAVPPSTDTPDAPAPAHAASSPQQATATKRFVDPEDELALPLHKRVVVQYAKDAYGKTELRLFYDDKEISFDEPELFRFGETLAKQSRFVARTATQWADGQPWPRVQGLLEQLIEEGVLRYAQDAADEKGPSTTEDGARPSPLPPAQTQIARSWLECEAITGELTGRPLELGHLELVIPIFRVAHMSMDADGRQVGEANVFPKAMRLDVPTNWRTCIYPGTRHLDPKPMNVTALKAMRSHWGQMMSAVLRIRAAYLQRYPEAFKGWTVGHLERLSVAVLALPTYQLMRMHNGVENGKLHPALSSLFRVTDGVRMTMHQMLFIPIGEPTTLPDAPMTRQEILDYAERNYSFHSEFGVCAGPRAMIEEFLGVLVDGHPARNAGTVVLDAEVEAALADIEFAIDYGLSGLQAYAAVFSLWPIMTRTYERLWDIALAWQAQHDTPPVSAFVERLRGILAHLKTVTYLGAEQWRVDREKVYADMYRQCGKGLRLPEHAQSLTERIAPRRDVRLTEIEQQLRGIVSRHFQASENDPHLEQFLTCLVDYFSQEQAILQVACVTQRHINALLGRKPPQRPFSASEIDIHVLLQGRDARQVPYLESELQSILGVQIVINQDQIRITENAAA